MPKIEDVAKHAGVSVTTVSRVLNDRGYISQKTRDNVHRAMQELNYQPNEMARALFRKKSHMIGLIVPDVSHPFFSELAYYVELAADRHGYKLLLCNSKRAIAKEKQYIDMLRKNKVDGIIMGSSVLDVDHYLHLELPIISLDRQLSAAIPVVTSDNVLGGQLAAQRLLEKGCQYPAYVYRGLGGPHHDAMLASGRVQGYGSVLEAAGIQPLHVQLDATVSQEQSVNLELVRFLQEHPEVDGIFASSDVIAAEVIQACHHCGIQVPERLGVIGYDDVNIASLVTPRLTTIRQPIEEMATCLIEMLLRHIVGDRIPHETVLPVSLIERATT
ncbi:LacI family DNA-binding transcriptional regulator [Paenibacillus campi]|uniref:LacI family DNA-binding transcriptional regulator n=1 Tax=Paenibacillus campi TaxID=3106031 RepID=UPI002AFEA063|nr:LacI family DNA-binding transcriptional regulator [Paenibacillus sp. SGZ-1014]